MLDYIVVGLGLAGISFCETLERNGKTFKVFNDTSQQASKVAGGLYNPVILKRFTLVWRVEEQLAEMLPFYRALEKKLSISLIGKLRVLRRFASVQEQNDWFMAADRGLLKAFLSTGIQRNKNPNIAAPLGLGEVLGTGKIDCANLLIAFQVHMHEKGNLIPESFDFGALQQLDDGIAYKELKARQIVFAEGYGMHRNPYFDYLPLTGTKGEYLIIEAPNLSESNAIKSAIFIIPEGNDRYRIGATYKWKDKTNRPTEMARLELMEKLGGIISCDYKIVDHLAGIRPTVTDRRPLIGRHPQNKNLYVLNGFGSRGVMIGPWAAQRLFDLIEKGKTLYPEMDIARFTKKYYRPSF